MKGTQIDCLLLILLESIKLSELFESILLLLAKNINDGDDKIFQNISNNSLDYCDNIYALVSYNFFETNMDE